MLRWRDNNATKKNKRHTHGDSGQGTRAFLERGYTETSLRDIAEAAGLSPSAIYRYFKGKRELFDSLDIPQMKQVRPGYDKKRAVTLSTALGLFGEKGYDGTTMEDISLACGISKATLYMYYDSKEDLLMQVLRENAFNACIRRIGPDSSNGDFKDIIKAVGRDFLAISSRPEGTALLRAAITESAKHPEIGALCYAQGIKAACDDVTNYLAGLQREGRVVLWEVDLYAAVQAYFGALLSYLVLNSVIEGIPKTGDAEAYLDAATDLFLRGMCRQGN